jgi:hypothetical protein
MQLMSEKGREMKINSKDCRVQSGETVELAEWPTTVKPVERGVSGTPGKTSRGIKLPAAASLRLKSLCAAADLSRHGRSGQGRRDLSCDVRS